PARSTTVTSTPCSCRCHAVARPTMPAPTTTAVRGAGCRSDADRPGRGREVVLTPGSFDRRPPRGWRGGRVAGVRRDGAARLQRGRFFGVRQDVTQDRRRGPQSTTTLRTATAGDPPCRRIFDPPSWTTSTA